LHPENTGFDIPFIFPRIPVNARLLAETRLREAKCEALGVLSGKTGNYPETGFSEVGMPLQAQTA
jgi:hypothetical protein